MKKAQAIKALEAIECEAGISGIAEIENVGETDRATAEKVYVIVKDEDMAAEIVRRQHDEEELFGQSRTSDEIMADIVRQNAKYAALIAAAPETAEENYRVVC